jgi:hypothetical protein
MCFLFANTPGLWTIPLPIRFTHPAPWLQYIWLIGYLAIMGWFLFSHFHFRSKLLKAGTAITDERILALWKKELELARYPKKPFLLYTSPVTQTPLSIGLFHRSTVVVLPEKAYSEEDLKLILRHELIHICRYDTLVKFVIMTFSAFLWFNPLMWISMRSCFNDLELSCDETVLLDADAGQRRQYADLLLRTAGDERGFTTCLSASARALRYRLHWVVNPVKRFTGSFLAGAILFGLMFTCGHVTLAFDQTTGADLIFAGESPALYELDDNEVYWLNRYVGVKEPEALKDYLAGLEICDVSGLYELEEGPQEIRIFLEKDGESIRVTLSDHVMGFRGHGSRYESYYVEDEIDWDYLESLLWLEPPRG